MRTDFRRTDSGRAGSRRATRGARGFTLLEVLVAFTIAALALAVLAEAAVDGMRSAKISSRYGEALVRARSHLAGLAMPPQVGDFEGDEGGGFHWHLRVTAGPRETTRQNIQVQLFDVAISMTWTDGDDKRALELTTRRAAAVRPS